MPTKIIERGGPSSYLSRFLPILSWLPHYSREWLTVDILAGLTLWGLLAPEAMAYAGIAGLPPQTGLYTLLASLLVYALFGTSRHLSVGPTSATAALIGSTILALGVSPSDMDSYQAYAFMLVLVVGVVFLAAGFARLGFITQFLSKPVMDGFVMGLAIFVAVGQLHKLFGVEKGEGNTLVKLLSILRQLAEANWITFAIGVIALALLFLLPRLSKRIPTGLAVLFGFILLGSVLNLSERFGVEVIGKLPQGLPALAIPWVPPTKILGMILPAIGIVLVAYSEALGVAREFAEKHGYKVDPDQELTAQGFTNLVSSLFGGMIAAGGMSGSAVKEGAGARTQVSNLVAWVAVVVTVLFLTPLFTYLPEAVLGALIIHAVWHLIAARKLRQIRLVSRSEFFLGVLTLAGVLLWDVLPGMVIGLLASLLHFIYITSRPHIAFLGRNPDLPEAYSDLERHPENIPVPGLLIVRFDAPLFYANAQTFSELVLEKVNKDQPKAVLLDAVVQDRLDVTSAEVLMGLVRELHNKGVAVYTAEVHGPVREFSQRTGLLDLIGEDRTFPTIDTAVRFIETSAEWVSNNK